MKKAALTLLILFVAALSFAQIEDLAKDKELKGHVKMITAYNHTTAEKNSAGIFDNTRVTKYDPAGNKTDEVISWDSSTAHGLRFTYSYNKEGLLIEKDRYQQRDNSLDGKFICAYKKGNKEVEVSEYDDKGKVIYTEIYKRDQQGRDKEMVSYYNSHPGIKHTDNYVYDEKGNKIEEDHDYDDNFDATNGARKMIFIYNEKGELSQIRNEYKGLPDYVRKISYEAYDSAGNWTKRYIQWSDRVIAVTERQIEYYK